jgi:phage tail tape-measure protein
MYSHNGNLRWQQRRMQLLQAVIQQDYMGHRILQQAFVRLSSAGLEFHNCTHPA